MRRGARVGLVVASSLAAGVLAVALLAWCWVRTGLSVHGEPPALEAAVVRALRSWAVPPELRRTTNPLPPSAEVLSSGRAHFADHCASCHGNDGRGETEIGQRLYPRAPDMTLPATQELSDGALFAIIENGVRLTGMPGWGEGTAESAYDTWTLVHFIRHLPELDPDELREMEDLNPMPRAHWEQMAADQAFLRGEDPPAEHEH